MYFVFMYFVLFSFISANKAQYILNCLAFLCVDVSVVCSKTVTTAIDYCFVATFRHL